MPSGVPQVWVPVALTQAVFIDSKENVMQVDDTQFPLVFLREHEQEHTSQQTQDQLEALLNRGQRFVLLTERLGGEDRNQE